MTENIFKDCENLIKSIELLLERQSKELRGNFYGSKQKVSDLQQRVIKYKGIFVPFVYLDHRILFDGFEVGLVELFLSLYKAIYDKEKDNVFVEFSLRTLSEISFKRIQVLFSNKITRQEKNRMKLLILLADYGKLGLDNPKNQRTYRKLLEEFKDTLTVKQKKLCGDLMALIKKKDSEKLYKLIRKLRGEINRTQNNLFEKTGLLSIFRREQLYVLFYEWSHLLHGNLLLLNDVFSKNRPRYRHKLRVYWSLILCGMNAVIYIDKYLSSVDYSKELGEVDVLYQDIKKFLAQNWRSIEKSR